jgi:diguanylate cyclase (GGDEF)-like protein
MLLFPAHCASLPTMTDPAKRLDCSLGANARWFGHCHVPVRCTGPRTGLECHLSAVFPRARRACPPGEPYRDNLRRFYQGRLGPDEIERIDRYIDAGIARHRMQNQPYAFEHHGRPLVVSSLPLPEVGRLRLWCLQQGAAQDPQGQGAGLPQDLGALYALLDRVPNGLMQCDDTGAITWVNASFALKYGLHDPRAALGRTLEEVFRQAWTAAGTPDAPACVQGLQTLREMMRFTGAPFELTLPGPRTVRVQARPGVDSVHLYAHIDITELRLQQERLAEAEQAARDSATALARESALLQATLQNMEQGVAMINPQGRIEFYNQRILELLDLPRELLDTQPLLEDVIRFQREHGEFEGQPPQALAHLSPHSLGTVQPLAVRQRPNGRMIEVRSIPVAGGGLLRTFTDVTERHQHQQHIEHLASHDSLTGLYNRAKFMECLVAEVALARRQQGRLAVLYLDLDGFKPINDAHGHAAGDQVLVWVGQTLRRVARESDFVARLGGDEFAVLQRGIDHYDQAVALAQRLADALSQPWTLGKLRVQVGASIGIALYPEHGSDPEALLAAADQAMYLVKTGNRKGGSLVVPRQTRGGGAPQMS